MSVSGPNRRIRLFGSGWLQGSASEQTGKRQHFEFVLCRKRRRIRTGTSESRFVWEAGADLMGQLMQSAALLSTAVSESVAGACARGVPHRCLRSVISHPASLGGTTAITAVAAFVAINPAVGRVLGSRAAHVTPPRAGRARVWLDAWALEGGVFFLSFFLSFRLITASAANARCLISRSMLCGFMCTK